MCRRYGYPRLTPQIKRKILGLNSARLYGLQPPHNTVSRGLQAGAGGLCGPHHPRAQANSRGPERSASRVGAASPLAQYESDGLAKLKQAYTEAGGTRSNTRYGWLRTRT
jgi:hypothetical protein